MRTKLAAWGCLSLVLSFAAAGCDAPPDPAAPELQGREEDEPVPGGACLTSKECVLEEYCATPEGECGREGVCTPVPAECDRTRAPVCSCDGGSFNNSCNAAQAKQSVDFGGSCPPPPCTSNAECGASQYCATATGACGSSGVCANRPAFCSGVWKPVCGCNGNTYANACKAAQVGVPVQHTGTC